MKTCASAAVIALVVTVLTSFAVCDPRSGARGGRPSAVRWSDLTLDRATRLPGYFAPGINSITVPLSPTDGYAIGEAEDTSSPTLAATYDVFVNGIHTVTIPPHVRVRFDPPLVLRPGDTLNVTATSSPSLFVFSAYRIQASDLAPSPQSATPMRIGDFALDRALWYAFDDPGSTSLLIPSGVALVVRQIGGSGQPVYLNGIPVFYAPTAGGELITLDPPLVARPGDTLTVGGGNAIGAYLAFSGEV